MGLFDLVCWFPHLVSIIKFSQSFVRCGSRVAGPWQTKASSVTFSVCFFFFYLFIGLFFNHAKLYFIVVFLFLFFFCSVNSVKCSLIDFIFHLHLNLYVFLPLFNNCRVVLLVIKNN